MMHSNHNPDSMIKDGQNRTGQRKNCLYTQIDTYNLIHTQLLLPIFISTDLHPFYIYFRNGRAAAIVGGGIIYIKAYVWKDPDSSWEMSEPAGRASKNRRVKKKRFQSDRSRGCCYATPQLSNGGKKRSIYFLLDHKK